MVIFNSSVKLPEGTFFHADLYSKVVNKCLGLDNFLETRRFRKSEATIHCYMLYTAYLDVRRRWLCCFCNEIVDAFRGVLLYYILSHLIHMSIWCSVFWKTLKDMTQSWCITLVFFFMFPIDIRRHMCNMLFHWTIQMPSFWSRGYDPKNSPENLRRF